MQIEIEQGKFKPCSFRFYESSVKLDTIIKYDYSCYIKFQQIFNYKVVIAHCGAQYW